MKVICVLGTGQSKYLLIVLQLTLVKSGVILSLILPVIRVSPVQHQAIVNGGYPLVRDVSRRFVAGYPVKTLSSSSKPYSNMLKKAAMKTCNVCSRRVKNFWKDCLIRTSLKVLA